MLNMVLVSPVVCYDQCNQLYHNFLFMPSARQIIRNMEFENDVFVDWNCFMGLSCILAILTQCLFYKACMPCL